MDEKRMDEEARRFVDRLPPQPSDLMRLRSGKVDSDDPLVCFLYLLARDHLPAGQVEEIMKECRAQGVGAGKQTMHFTNGWLATWAMDMANRLNESID